MAAPRGTVGLRIAQRHNGELRLQTRELTDSLRSAEKLRDNFAGLWLVERRNAQATSMAAPLGTVGFRIAQRRNDELSLLVRELTAALQSAENERDNLAEQLEHAERSMEAYEDEFAAAHIALLVGNLDESSYDSSPAQ